MYKYIIVYLTIFSIIFTVFSTLNTYSSIDQVLDKGDKFIYEVRCRAGDSVFADYFEVSIRDKYVADKVLFDIYARYYNSTSGLTIAKDYKSISSWELSRIIPIASKIGGEFTGAVYLTIPVKNYNNRISDDEPIGAKILNLNINEVSEKSIDIGGSRVNIRVAVLQGVADNIDYEVFVDYNSGLLIFLKASRGGNELFTILLTYSTKYVAILQNNAVVTSEVRNNKSLGQVIPIVLVAIVSIVILMVLVSYLSRISL